MELTEKMIERIPALKKFKNERKCEFCEGTWIFTEGDNEKYCPNCAEIALKQIRKKDLIYKDATNEQLDGRVTAIENQISQLTELVKQLVPKKQPVKYNPKKCISCENEFTPKFPAQKRCPDCVGEDS